MTAPFRIALVGTGNIARDHLEAYRGFPEKVKLAAVCDVREDALQKFAREANVESTYLDFERMLREAPIDAVDLCTVHDQHAPLAIAAARAGKHVLVEKPMGCSLDECRQMLAAAEKSGVTLMVAQHQRYTPSYRGVRKLIQRGDLGVLHAVRFDAMQDMPGTVPSSHWIYDGKKAGGGIVISVSVHRLDLMRYLIGEVKRVTAHCRTMHPGFSNGAEDFAAALLEFENGAIGEMFGTYSGVRMPWGEQFMLFGSEGAVHAVPNIGAYAGPAFVATRKDKPPVEGWLSQYSGFTPVQDEHDGLPSDSGIVNEILHFAECAQSKREPLSSGKDNFKTMQLVFAIYESSKLGRPVNVSDL